MDKFESRQEINMIEWIVATKDSKTKEFYAENYCYDYEFTDELAGSIIAQYFLYSAHKEELADAMRYLSMDLIMNEMMRGTNKYTYNEMLWYAWKTWCFHLTVKKLDEMFGNKWKSIFEDMRKSWKQ